MPVGYEVLSARAFATVSLQRTTTAGHYRTAACTAKRWKTIKPTLLYICISGALFLFIRVSIHFPDSSAVACRGVVAAFVKQQFLTRFQPIHKHGNSPAPVNAIEVFCFWILLKKHVAKLGPPQLENMPNVVVSINVRWI